MTDLAFAEAFSKYGAKLKNVQWSVCADAPDGSLVVSLWQHHFDPVKDGVISCRGSFARWSGPGNTEFRAKVINAFHTDQNVKVVIARTDQISEVESGADASKLKNTFSIKEDWIGKVTSVVGDDYEFKFLRK
ncbi:hypothetical protein [Methylotenera sp.]|uniref:hypothetical protein n=1 Tax=Methylotenera sp. TaxID=2051956 RepID=UPI002736393A|nr:hypothetical protein [Methylotenera sp.]MDP3211924.1 hypothetical protein [Methylotenera sp.]